MTARRIVVLVLLLLMVQGNAISQTRHARHSRRKPVAPGVAGLKVVPDLGRRVARYKRVVMPFQTQGLSPRERELVGKLVEASHYIEDIYWRQSDPEALTLYQDLAGRRNTRDRQLRRYLFINASCFDLLNENQPFVCTQAAAAANKGACPPMPPGRGYYPAGLSREQIEQYVSEHPGSKEQIFNEHTIVRWKGEQLEGVPYHVAYRSFLEPAGAALRQAAALSDDQQFAHFLRLRADALLSDDYFPSDLAWLDMQAPKFDVIFAPYETYDDGLLGVKTSYGAAVLVRNEAESRKLEVYQKYIPEIQEALPLAPADLPSKRGHQSPMEVMDAPFRAGDLDHGYQAVADNLPNDPRIHEQKGSKKIFFKNFMDARVSFVVLPIAKAMMRRDQAALVSGEGYMADTLLHEISHGLGPAFARINGKQVDVREAIGPTYSGLEEAKADVVGLYGLNWLTEHGAIARNALPGYYSTHVADLFRTVRFSVAEAHGMAAMMEFNYFAEQKAIRRGADGRYAIDYARMPAAVASLAKELLEIEATGDRARAEAWFRKYGQMPPELNSALKAVAGVPVDTQPVFSFPQTVD